MAEMMFVRGKRSLVAAATLLALSISLAPQVASAQPTSAPSQKNTDEAVVRYKRALDLFNDGSFDAALLEFRRAYELAPNYRVLYNIALVNVQLNDYAGALGAFEQYLADGGSEVPAARTEEVKHEIARLGPRVATLDVTTDEPGADISVDDLPIGKTPLAHPVRINAGRRRISVASAGHVPQARLVEAAGGDAIQLKFELNEPHATPAGAPTPIEAPPTPREENRHFPWFAWTVTGALAAGTAVTGVLALKAHSDQDDTKHRLGATPGELDAASKKTQHLALASDILLGATAVMGGISIYLTARSPSHPATSDQAKLTLLPGGVSAQFEF